MIFLGTSAMSEKNFFSTQTKVIFVFAFLEYNIFEV